MTKKIRFAYCSVCKTEVEKSARRPLETMQKLLWGIVIVATLGIAAIAYAFYLSNRPKIYCPKCFNKLEYSDKPFEKPKKKREEMTPKERILEKTGLVEEPEEEETKKTIKPKKGKKEKKEKEEEPIICSFCGEKLDEDYPTCPFCQAVRKL
ncbi:MAG: hypothetical protein ACFFEY_18060 [Candidatus Thorarchaeota archaeon]